MNIKDMEKEIQEVIKDLVGSTEGASLEGKARAMTIASDYLFEFWKRAAASLPAKKARVKAMEAMHRKLITKEKEEDLVQLQKDIKEASNVFNTKDKGDVESAVSEEGKDDVLGLRNDVDDTSERLEGSETGTRLQVSKRAVQRTGEETTAKSSSAVVHPEAPEGRSRTELGQAVDQKEDIRTSTGGRPPDERAESTPLTILPADGPLDGGERHDSSGGFGEDKQGHQLNGAAAVQRERGKNVGRSETEARRGWKDSSAKGRKKMYDSRMLQPRPAEGVRTEHGDFNMQPERADGRRKGEGREVPDGDVLLLQPVVSTGEGREQPVLPDVRSGATEEVDEMSKNFREMDETELTEKIDQVLRSKSDAMEGFDGTDIKEVRNVRVGKGALGTANQNVIVGRKRCVNCSFELPGYETVCVACKQPQPLIKKP